MKAGYQLFSACFVALGAAALHTSSMAAESPVVAQDLASVRSSNRIEAALWTRRQDSYTLQIVFPSDSCFIPRANAATVAAAAKQAEAALPEDAFDRQAFFIGNTIANLRGLDPNFCGRTLTLVDGRRPVSPPDSSRAAEPAAPPKATVVPPKGPPGIQVWLLRADGTQIAPVAVAEETSTAYGCKSNCPVSGKQYRFPLLEGAQAVAVAISVDDVYYIEKLQPLEPASLKQ